MKIAVWVASATMVSLATAQPPHSSPPEEATAAPPLFVRASVSTAGAYGQNWHLTLSPNREVFLQVFYGSNPSGNLMAHFTLSERQVGAIRKACEAQRFFELPADLAPQRIPLHRPHLQIEIHLGVRHHKVSLSDPSALRAHSAADRFLAVWKAVFETLPLRPSW